MFQFLSAIPQLLGGAGSAVAGMPGMAGQLLNSIPQMAGTALPYVLGTPQKALGAVGDLAKGAGGLIQDIMGGGGGASTGVQGMNVAAGQAGANPGAAMVANATNPATYGGGATVPMAGATGVAPQGGGQGFLGKAWDAWSNFFNDPNKVGALGAIGAAISPQGSPSANLGQFAFQMSQNAKAAQEQAKQAKKDEEFMSRLAGMIGGGGFGGQGGSGVSPAMSATPQLEGGYTPFQNPQSDFKSMQSGGFASSPQTSTVNPKTATSGQPSAGRGTSSAPTVASEAAKTPIVSKASSPAGIVGAQVIANKGQNKPEWTILTPTMQSKIASGQNDTWNKMMDLARLDLSLQSNKRAIREEYRKLREEDMSIRQQEFENSITMQEEQRRQNDHDYEVKKRELDKLHFTIIGGVPYYWEKGSPKLTRITGSPDAPVDAETAVHRDTMNKQWMDKSLKDAKDWAGANNGGEPIIHPVTGQTTWSLPNMNKYHKDVAERFRTSVINAVALGDLSPQYLAYIEKNVPTGAAASITGDELYNQVSFVDNPEFRKETLKRIEVVARAAGLQSPISKEQAEQIAKDSKHMVGMTLEEFQALPEEEQNKLIDEHSKQEGDFYILEFIDQTKSFKKVQ